MNIFMLDETPNKAALYHCDKHVPKMILESAQLLSTAHRLLNGSDQVYKAAYVNHPCAIWVRQCSENYEWTYYLFIELNKQFVNRFGGKDHASYAKLSDILSVPPLNLPKGSMTDPALAMPDIYKIPQKPVESYRNYYKQAKTFATWDRICKGWTPDWWNDF
jgi:hypothetical protein